MTTNTTTTTTNRPRKPRKVNLFNCQNAKTIKGEKLGILTGVCYLAPARMSKVMNVCTSATIHCIEACLFEAGRGRMRNVRDARIKKTVLLANDRAGFMAIAQENVERLQRRATKSGLKLAIRPNGTSDLPWLAMQLADANPGVQFYDYTKHAKPWLRVRPNYHLTFSYSGLNLAESLEALAHGVNVAVVFTTRKGQPLPETWNGYRVIDADEHDVRFLDPVGVVCGLRAKGPAKTVVNSPFVVLAA